MSVLHPEPTTRVGSVGGTNASRVERSLPLSERIRRWHAPNDFWVGVGVVGFFVAIGLAAVEHFGLALGAYEVNPLWAVSKSPPGPSLLHPFGVLNGVGVDLLGSIWQATPPDLLIVGSILSSAAAIGYLLGSASALKDGGFSDRVVTIWSETTVGVPAFILVLIFYFGIGGGLPSPAGVAVFVSVFVLVIWPYYARPTRLRAKEVVSSGFYIEAARASGATNSQIWWRHILPNSMSPLFTQIPLDVANIFFVLIVYPWIGCYFQPPPTSIAPAYPPYPPLTTSLPFVNFPEWGYLTAVGACSGWSPILPLNFWWMYFFPMATIVLFGLGIMFLCDGLGKMTASAAS